MSARLDGRAYDETLARELGREMDDSESRPALGLRLGRGPNDNLLTPDVLRRGTCLDVVLAEKLLGVAESSPRTDEAVEPVGRLRERIVTVEGTLWTPLIED